MTERSIFRNATVVTLGTAGGQLIAFLGSLLTVRLFAPEYFGIFTTLSAVVACLTPLFSGRLDVAIPLPNRDSEAISLAKLSLLMTVLLSVGATVVILLVQLIWSPLDVPLIWIWAPCAMIVALAVYLLTHQLAVRFGAYRSIAIRGLLYPSTMSIVQILFGLAGAGPEGLVVGLVLGQLFVGLTIWWPIHRAATQQSLSDDETRLRGIELLRKYREFPMFLAPSGVINALGTQLPQIGMTLVFGLSDGGHFGVMIRILAAPVALIGQSLGYVYTSEIAKQKRAGTGNVVATFNTVSKRLAVAAALLLIALIAVGPPMLTLVLGEDWAVAAEMARLYSFAVAVQLFVVPVSQTLIVAGGTKVQLWLDLGRVLLILSVFAASALFGLSIAYTLGALSLVVGLSYLGAWFVYRSSANRLVRGS